MPTQPTTSEIKSGILKAHAAAGPAITAFLQARDAALATHANYVAAYQAFKKARALSDPARNLTKSWIDYFSSNPNGQEWLAWLAPYWQNDNQIRTEMDDSLGRLLADNAAHAVIKVRTPGGETVNIPPASSAPVTTKTPVLTQKPNGSIEVTDPDGTVTVTPDGQVEETPWALIVGAAAGLALLLRLVFRTA